MALAGRPMVAWCLRGAGGRRVVDAGGDRGARRATRTRSSASRREAAPGLAVAVVTGRREPLGVGRDRARGGRRRAWSCWSTTPRGRCDAGAVRPLRRAARALGLRRRGRGRAGGRHDQGGRRRRPGARDARARATCGRCRRRRCSGADAPAPGAGGGRPRARLRRRPAGRGRRRRRAVVEAPRHNLKVTTRPTSGSRSCCSRSGREASAADADRLPHAPAPGRHRRRPPSATSRSATSRRYLEAAARAGHLRARLLRARAPVPRRRSTSGAIRSGRRTPSTTSTPTSSSSWR